MVHQHILGAGKYGLENLRLDDVSEGTDYKFVSMPMKIYKAGETPVRVMAVKGGFSGAAQLAAFGLGVAATMTLLF